VDRRVGLGLGGDHRWSDGDWKWECEFHDRGKSWKHANCVPCGRWADHRDHAAGEHACTVAFADAVPDANTVPDANAHAVTNTDAVANAHAVTCAVMFVLGESDYTVGHSERRSHSPGDGDDRQRVHVDRKQQCLVGHRPYRPDRYRIR
jgi:hypothetical protein